MRHSSCLALGVLLSAVAYGQQPVLQGYPFAKGVYSQAVEEDGLLYCATDLGMAIWDVTDSLQPVLLSRYVFTGGFDGKAIKRGPIVFLGKEHGIQAVDVSDPANPAGQLLDLGDPGHSSAFEVMDTLLFTTRGGSLITWSISDLDNPVPLDTVGVDMYSLSRTDTMLVGGREDRVYRLGIGTGLPILLDEIPVQAGYLLGGVQYAGDRLAVHEIEPMNGQATLALYDMSVVGSPVATDVIDELPFGERILYMDGALLVYSLGTDLQLYDISVPGQAQLASTVTTTWPQQGSVVRGDLLYTLSISYGFCVFQRTGPTDLSLLASHGVGDWLTTLKATSNGHVIGLGRDSLYVLDPAAPGVGEGIRDSRYYDALEWWVFGDLLVERRTLPGFHPELTLLRVEADGTLTELTTMIPLHALGSTQLAIWNDRLYWSGFSSGESITDIYDLADPSTPVYMGFVQARYQLERDGILFSLFPDMGWVDLYDAATFPPAFLAQKNFDLGCAGLLYPDPERTLLHQVGLSCYAVLDLRDTANVQALGPITQPPVFTTMAHGTGVWNRILYIPDLNGRKISIFDVGVPGFLTAFPPLSLTNFPRDLAFVDSTMFVAFGGYVEQYDVSGVLPDLTVSLGAERAEAPLLVYPNPSSGGFHLQTPDPGGMPSELEVRDATGRLVLRRTIPGGGGQAWVPCEGLPGGLYALRLLTGAGVRTAKLVLE